LEVGQISYKLIILDRRRRRNHAKAGNFAEASTIYPTIAIH